MCEGDAAALTRRMPTRRRRRRTAPDDFPAVQSLATSNLLAYTETPLRSSTLDSRNHGSFCGAIVLVHEEQLDWIVAATVQGTLLFWKFQELPANTNLNVAIAPQQTVNISSSSSSSFPPDTTSMDRIVRLIQLQDEEILVVTILGNVYQVFLAPAGETSEQEETWKVKTHWSMTGDDDIINIRHVIVWNKDTLICATESYGMAWVQSECLWKHQLPDITAMELLGSHYLIVVPHDAAIQVLDLLQLSVSIMDATVLARPGYELVPSTTEGSTIIHRRATDSSVVLAFSDGKCFLVSVMEDSNDGIMEWGVVGAPVQLPVPAVGIGTDSWGDVLYCLPAGSTVASDITGSITAAWMLPVGIGEHEDIVIPVEGFAAACGFCVYQWPNGVMDLFSVQRPMRQLLSGLVDNGIANELVQWLLHVEDSVLARQASHFVRARKELEKLDTSNLQMEDLFVSAPSLRKCLLSIVER